MGNGYLLALSFLLVVAFGFSIVEAADPIAYWDFDSDFDDSVGSNNLENVGCVLTDGISGNSSYVNDSHLIGREMSDFDLAPGDVSAGAWVNIAELSGDWQTVLEYDRWNSNGSHTSWFGIWVAPDNKFHFRVGHVANWHTIENFSSSVDLVEDKWYYLTATFDNETKIGSLYVDGKLDSSFDLSDYDSSNWTMWTENSSSFFTVGKSKQRYNETYEEPFFGAIDELKIYEDALTAEEVLAEYNSVIPHNIVLELFAVAENASFKNDSYDAVFEFNVSGDHNISECSLFLNGNVSGVTNLTNGTVSFSVDDLVEGSYDWYVECFDDYDNSEVSDTWSFSVDGEEVIKEQSSGKKSSGGGSNVQCDEWSMCFSGSQTRKCGAGVVTRSCEVPADVVELNNDTSFSSADFGEYEEVPSDGFFSAITGAVIGGGRTIGVGIGILILLVIAGFIAVSAKRKKKVSKKVKKSSSKAKKGSR